jgi:hypothetical protein
MGGKFRSGESGVKPVDPVLGLKIHLQDSKKFVRHKIIHRVKTPKRCLMDL